MEALLSQVFDYVQNAESNLRGQKKSGKNV